MNLYGRRSALLIAFSMVSLAQELPIDDEQQKEIARLLEKALNTEDAQAQIEIYGRILKLDPSNQNAFNGITNAKQKLAQERKDREKTDQERAHESELAGERAAATQQADAAIAEGNLDAARTAIETLRKLSPGDNNLSRLESDVQTLLSYRQWTWWGGGGAAAILGGGLAALYIFGKRQTTPFLEVVEGDEPGKQFILSEEVTLIGSVEKFEDLANDIVLSDPEGRIAKAHCEIHKKNKKLYLLDLFSANQTIVDDHPAEPEKPVFLRTGSRINLGGAITLRLGYTKGKTK